MHVYKKSYCRETLFDYFNLLVGGAQTMRGSFKGGKSIRIRVILSNCYYCYTLVMTLPDSENWL